jgi:hypothetical protein
LCLIFSAELVVVVFGKIDIVFVFHTFMTGCSRDTSVLDGFEMGCPSTSLGKDVLTGNFERVLGRGFTYFHKYTIWCLRQNWNLHFVLEPFLEVRCIVLQQGESLAGDLDSDDKLMPDSHDDRIQYEKPSRPFP